MWKDWLALSKREQKGFIVLSSLLFLLVVFYIATPFFFAKDVTDISPDMQYWTDSTIRLNRHSSPTDSLFFFDPNTVSVFEMEKLGVNNRTIIKWIKFREAGGRFEKAGDFWKIFGNDTLTAKRLTEYVIFSTFESRKQKKSVENPITGKTANARSHKHNKPEKKREVVKNITVQKFVIEINSADTTELMRIKGIGRVFAKRIISYRKILGGYFSVDQLKDVYGLPPSVVDENRDHFTVDTTKLIKINVNKASIRKLKSHPYIDFYLARAILELKKKKGHISNINEILSLKEVKPDIRDKLTKYLGTN